MLFKRLIALVGLNLAFLAAASLFCAGGCSENQSAEREQSNLKVLAVFYGQFVGQHRGQPPANEQEFKKFIQSLGKASLSSMKVTNPDDLFTSPRDGKPYVVLYGPLPKNGAGTGLPSATVVAYEQEGKGGKRFIARSLGAIEEVDEAQFKQLVPKGQ